MEQNTTKGTASPRAVWRASGLLCRGICGPLALAALLALLGCTTAQDRASPTNIVGVLRFRDGQAADLFRDTHRAGNLYNDFRPVMSVDAVPMDLRYRALYLEMLKQRYLLPEGQLAPMKSASDQEFDNAFELIVLIYGGTNETVPLDKTTSVWRVLLRDDDGQLLPPSKMEKIKEDSPVYQYLNTYFYGLDRWTQIYRMGFPKLAKNLVGQPLGKEPVQLIVTGVAGTVVLSWLDPRLFYRPTAGAGAQPQASQSVAPEASRDVKIAILPRP